MSLTSFPNGVKTFVVPKGATVKSAAFTATANTTYYITATCVVTLPAIAVGNTFTFINAGKTDGLVEITLAPNSSDGIAYGGSFANDKDAVNTLATSVVGDFLTLASGDQVVYWFTVGAQGVWAKES